MRVSGAPCGASATSTITTLVDTATNSASAAGNVAGSVVSSAGSVAESVLQPLLFDPLRRLQGGDLNSDQPVIRDGERLWIAVDGMGGDHAPGPILDGCLQALQRLPLKIKFVGEIERVHKAAKDMGIDHIINE